MDDLMQVAAAEVALDRDYDSHDVTAMQIAEANLGRYLLAYPSGRLADEARRKLAMLETAAAGDRADRKGSKEAALEDLEADSSAMVESNRHRALASLRAVEREQADDDAAWSNAQRGNTKGASTAYLTLRPNGRHAQTARARIAELERVIPAKPAAAIRTDKQAPRSARPSASVAHSGYRWPSAD